MAGILGAGLAYAENGVLNSLTIALAPKAGSTVGLAGWWGRAATALGLGIPFVILVSFGLTRAGRALITFWDESANGRLRTVARSGLEQEILLNLVRKDDLFFHTHPPGEILNRVALDIERATGLPPLIARANSASLLLASHIFFFLMKDVRFAIGAVVACLIGTALTRLLLTPVKEMDRDFLLRDDRSKSQFGEFLSAAPEIQNNNLFYKIRTAFERVQRSRSEVFVKFTRLNALLSVSQIGSTALALIAMIAVVILLHSRSGDTRVLALVPVIVYSLPKIFDSAATLVFVHLQVGLARTSIHRLLEYASDGPESSPDTVRTSLPAEKVARGPSGGDLRVDDVTYRYADAAGTMQGGVSGISTSFRAGQWTAIVGGAGSGKSTLVKILLGRLRPQAGRIRLGDRPGESLSLPEQSAFMTLMPQKGTLLNNSILENVLFGRSGMEYGANSPDALAERDMEDIESAGLGRICRVKALELMASDTGDWQQQESRIASLRARVRADLSRVSGLLLRPYEEGHMDMRQWMIERVLKGKCDQGAAMDFLLDRSGQRIVESMEHTELDAVLTGAGRDVLAGTRNLLNLSSHESYSRLARIPIGVRAWELRREHRALADQQKLTPGERLSLAQVGLTMSPVELAGTPVREEPSGARTPAAETALAGLREGLGKSFSAFAINKVHPLLSWRDNLVFAVLDATNERAIRQAEGLILDFVEREGLGNLFTRLGLGYQIGRAGERLSGGQGQLVALCRALLRRTPVLLLDEPTSALDPASRDRVAILLRRWATDRVVITVSHDMDFVRQADEVRLLEGGRLVASGTFAELAKSSDAFRRATGN